MSRPSLAIEFAIVFVDVLDTEMSLEQTVLRNFDVIVEKNFTYCTGDDSRLKFIITVKKLCRE